LIAGSTLRLLTTVRAVDYVLALLRNSSLRSGKEKQEPIVTYHIGYTQEAKEEGYYPLVDSNTDPYRYHYKRGQRIIRAYGTTTVHYSYKKAS
jgi:hypothetical protein